jgi:hypothetical protein
MQEEVARFIRGCILCCTNKPSNKKQRLYNPLLSPYKAMEIISMDFVGGFFKNKRA